MSLNSPMKFLLILPVLLLVGCSSTSRLVKSAPPEGIRIVGVNVLFKSPAPESATIVGSSGAAMKVGADTAARPNPPMDRLRNEIAEKLVLQLKEKGISANFASVGAQDQLTQATIQGQFASEPTGRHVLLIVPTGERKFCTSTCSTKFSVRLSLRAPNDYQEMWSVLLDQGEYTVADWVPGRNNTFIEDMGKSLLAVVRQDR